MSPLITSKRLRLYPLAALCGVAIGFIVLVATSKGQETALGGRLGGDLAAFYGAGRIVDAGMGRSLYDPALQLQMQAGLIPHRPTGWLHFAYPPFVALAYVPLAKLPFTAAYVVHTVLMAGCCLLALWMLRPMLPSLGSYFMPLFAVCLTFYPLFRAVTGGQNSPVSMLCAAGAIAALHRGREFSAGLWIGAWLFKPQYAIPVALVACRSKLAILGFVAMAAVYFLLSAIVMGLDWPFVWLRAGAAFIAVDRRANMINGISLMDWTAALGIPAVGPPLAILAALAVLALALTAKSRAIGVSVAAAAVPLVLPRALYYDAALALLALLLPAERWQTRLLPWLAAVWALGLAQSLRAFLPVPPMTVATIVALVAYVICLRTSTDAPETPQTPRSRSATAG